MDIVVGNTGSQNMIYFNDGSGERFEAMPFGTPKGVSYGVDSGDVSGDGYPDLGVANSNGMNFVIISRPASSN